MFYPKRKIEMIKKTNTKRPIHCGKSHKRLPLLDLLKEHSGERTSKLEAYLELVDMASAQYIPKDMDKENFHLQPDQFVTTITELADCWHWHRATVRSFIEQLEAMGQIKVTRLTRSQIITVPSDITGNGTSAPGKNDCVNAFMQKLRKVLSEWGKGDMSVSRCGELCGQLYMEAVKVCATSVSASADGKMPDSKSVHTELHHAAISAVCAATFMRVMGEDTASGTDRLQAFLDKDCAGDWESFIEAAQVLSELVADGKSSSLEHENAVVRSQFQSLCRPFLAVLTGKETGNGRTMRD